ncbi:MAG: F0F1 ATP synthase subunit B [Acidimicrobiia bacterium]
MRTLRLSLLALLIAGAVVLTPASAFASGSETPKCAKEVVDKLAKGEITEAQAEEESVDCFSAPSPIIPAWNEVLWGGVAFVIVAGGLIKFGFPAVKKGLQAREDKIREDLASAESSKQEAAQKAQDYEDKLKDAKSEAARIIEEAKTQAGEVKAGLIAKAEDEASAIRAKAQADADAIAARALNDIQDQVANLSVDLAEKVVKSNLDKKAQLDLVNSFIADLPKSSKN